MRVEPGQPPAIYRLQKHGHLLSRAAEGCPLRVVLVPVLPAKAIGEHARKIGMPPLKA